MRGGGTFLPIKYDMIQWLLIIILGILILILVWKRGMPGLFLIFGGRDVVVKNKENFSILDEGLMVEGTISCKGKMVIKGTVKGTLMGESVVIGEKGAVYADMKAGSVTVGGVFEGKIRALEELIILSTGNCEGKVVCKDLVIEPGGVLNAEVSSLVIQQQQRQPGPLSPIKEKKRSSNPPLKKKNEKEPGNKAKV